MRWPSCKQTIICFVYTPSCAILNFKDLHGLVINTSLSRSLSFHVHQKSRFTMDLKLEAMRAASGTSSKYFPTSETASTCKCIIIILNSSLMLSMMTEFSETQNYLKSTHQWTAPIGQKGLLPWASLLMKLIWFSLVSKMSLNLLKFNLVKLPDRVGTSGLLSKTRSMSTNLILYG